MKETIDMITQLVNGCGFPIAACAVLFLQNNKLRETLDKNTDALNSIREKIIELHNKN